MPDKHSYTRGLVLVFAVLLLVALAGCSSGSIPGEAGKLTRTTPPAKTSPVSSGVKPTNGLLQTSSGGGVTIDVEWQGIQNGMLIFNVTMDTHNVDLDPYDLRNLASLRDIDGKEYSPNTWNAPAGAHHRKGILAFAAPDSVSRQGAGFVELRIRDVARVKERVLRWQLS